MNDLCAVQGQLHIVSVVANAIGMADYGYLARLMLQAIIPDATNEVARR